MILAGIISVLFAVLQFFLDVLVFSSVFAAKALKALFPLLGKILLYGVGFWLLFKMFRAFVKIAAIGFGIGFFPCIIIYALKKLRSQS